MTSEATPRPIWRFEPLSAFRAPPSSISEATRTGLRGLLERFRVQSNLVVEEEEDGQPEKLSPEELDRIVPPAPIDLLGAALAEALDPWPGPEARGRIRLVVYPLPGLGSEAVRVLARDRDWPLLEPPTPETLLGVDGTAAARSDILSRTKGPIVVPDLERWFLRHPKSLPRMRELLGSLSLRREPTLVSCGSWAYAWLRGALQADAVFAEPLALAALDAEAMGSWLGSSFEGSWVCREHEGGQILPSRENDDADVEVERSNFLRHLTAEARGNAIVASALWRSALRRASRRGADGKSVEDEVASALPWSTLVRPSLGRQARPEEIAVLHTLAIHGALSLDTLERTLPFGSATLARALASFSDAGLAEEADGLFRITPAGFPAVRRELIAAGHLADDF